MAGNGEADERQRAMALVGQLGSYAGLKRPMAGWVSPVFKTWIGRARAGHDLVEVAKSGMTGLIGRPALIEALHDLDAKLGADEEGSEHFALELERAKAQAALVAKEVERDFPLLHGLTCVWLWSALETLVEDLLVAALQNDDRLAASEELRDIRVPIAAAASGDREVLARTVYRELEVKKGAGFRAGVSRFEGLLNLLDLGGSVPEDHRRALYELSSVPNVILHRGSAIDVAFLDACPWFGAKVGEELRVQSWRLEGYSAACIGYVAMLMARFGDRYPPNAADLERAKEPTAG